MSAMSDLAYDIEQLYMDDFSPTRIAKILDIPLSMVYDWLQDNQLTPTSFEDWPEDDRMRHLLRMWIAVPNSRPLSPLLARIYRDQSAGAVRGGFPSKIPGKIVFETTEKWENEMTATH